MNPYLHQPREVAIETLALCNARCTFCPYPTIERQGARMPDELLSRLMDELATFDHAFSFTPFKLSDPLIEPRIEAILARLAHIPMASLRLFTNGQALTEAKLRAIAGVRNVEHLWVSLNEIDAQRYREVMGLDLRITLRNLDRLHDHVVAGSFGHKVIVSAVGTERTDVVAFIQGRWPRFETWRVTRNSWLGFTEAETTEVPDTTCGRWWEINIHADGKVALCCQDADARFAIGDVTTQTILEVYNSWYFKERRQKLLSRRQVPVCRTCTY